MPQGSWPGNLYQTGSTPDQYAGSPLGPGSLPGQGGQPGGPPRGQQLPRRPPGGPQAKPSRHLLYFKPSEQLTGHEREKDTRQNTPGPQHSDSGLSTEGPSELTRHPHTESRLDASSVEFRNLQRCSRKFQDTNARWTFVLSPL